MEPKPTAIDLFAGAGGATQGLRDAGFRVLAAVEYDKSAAATFKLNHPRTRVIEGDIRSVDPLVLRNDLKLERGQLTLLKACPPCQGFSTLGATNPDDERNNLVAETWRFIQEFQPRAWILENVRGLQNDWRLTKLMRQTRAVGYSVRCYVVNAADFGVPQSRTRLIVVGARTPRALPTDLRDVLPSRPRRRMAASVFRRSARLQGVLDPLHRPRRMDELTLRRIKAVPVDGGRFDLPEDLQLACHSKVGRSASSPYGRVREGEPAPTMTTRCTTPSCGRFVHPTENRPLTLREAAMIQTFPSRYRFAGNYGSIERQIGNALPSLLGRAVGESVLRLLCPPPAESPSLAAP